MIECVREGNNSIAVYQSYNPRRGENEQNKVEWSIQPGTPDDKTDGSVWARGIRLLISGQKFSQIFLKVPILDTSKLWLKQSHTHHGCQLVFSEMLGVDSTSFMLIYSSAILSIFHPIELFP